ncbi:MAG: nuclear transport factor 2 family protein [Deltaproteobacteria bacterium]|nr:nuclear transport factor 2 family protein [Deltaproteobacteria bacterium]
MANLKELEAKVRRLEDKITRLEDIEEIKRLQRIYGYYLYTHQTDKILDLFSDNTESIEVADRGLFLGKEGVRKVFGEVVVGSEKRPHNAGDMHITMQLQGVVHLDPGGQRAKGRWHGWIIGVRTIAGMQRQTWAHGIYENEYIKENGKWKFRKLHFNLTFRTPYEDGWLKTPVIDESIDYPIKPDAKPTAYHPYPSGYVVPFHWEGTTMRQP